MKLTLAYKLALEDMRTYGPVFPRHVHIKRSDMLELSRAGYVKPAGPNKHGKMLWDITDAGRRALEDGK